MGYPVSTIGHVLRIPGNENRPLGFGIAYCGRTWSSPFDERGGWAKKGTIFGGMTFYTRLCKNCLVRVNEEKEREEREKNRPIPIQNPILAHTERKLMEMDE